MRIKTGDGTIHPQTISADELNVDVGAYYQYDVYFLQQRAISEILRNN